METSSSSSFIGQFAHPEYDYRVDFHERGEYFFGDLYQDRQKVGSYPLSGSTFEILSESDLPLPQAEIIKELLRRKYIPAISEERVVWLLPKNFKEIESVVQGAFSANFPRTDQSLANQDL
ncbi:MAG: hypothetical protein Q8S01_03025, partial [Ignavibacteria bacterium]|nr:hypothetical protein [Ignavibacteria bacterium]